jgi:hypothetical protein
MAIIDIGGGGLKDTRYLLDQGFHVTVIDKEDALYEMAAALHIDRLQAAVTSFEEYPFPEAAFTLASGEPKHWHVFNVIACKP